MLASEQRDNEIEALSSIYSDAIQVSTNANHITSKIVTYTYQSEILVTFHLDQDYPHTSKPIYTIKILGHLLTTNDKKTLTHDIDVLIHENVGSESLFLIIQRINEIIDEKSSNNMNNDNITNINYDSQEEDYSANRDVDYTTEFNNPEKLLDTSNTCHLNIIHGEITKERKSTFQSHMCLVQTMDDVKLFREIVISDKRIATATHNIFAYRFIKDNISYHDFDDDGETAAGGRLAEMMRLMKIEGVAVIVSR